VDMCKINIYNLAADEKELRAKLKLFS